MRYPSAIWYPGPVDKQGYPGLAVNAGKGVICHSMVGGADAALARLTGTERVSWHFSVLQSGKVLQHYESNAVAWHAGSETWNGQLIGIEHEGGADPVDEPLTPAQLQASTELVWWLSGVHHFQLLRDGPDKGLYEHNEVYQTACPSNRIPWAFYVEDEMTDADWAKLGDVVKLQVQLIVNAGLTDQQKRDVADVVKLQLRTTPPLPPQP